MGQNRIEPATPSPPAPHPVRAAIAHGAARTGVDFDYLLAQARVESGLDPDARAATSSATGLFQFIDSTWLSTLHKHGAAHGLGALASAIAVGPGGPRVTDPGLRQQILALRNDPGLASVMAGALAQDNRAALAPVLGREPDAGELYMAHFLGAGAAGRFLTALSADPAQSAAALFPKQAAANRAIFHHPGGQARSLGEVMELMRGKMARAMGDASPGEPWSAPPVARPAPTPWHAARADFSRLAQASPGQPAAARPMSALIADTFSMGGSSTGEHVRRAYGRLRSAGL